MTIKEKVRPFLPHAIAILLFTLLAFVYFYPVLEGKILKANDSTVSRIYSKEIVDFRTKEGTEPLWTDSLFGGMPAFLISVQYPGNLFKKLDTVLRIFGMPVSVLFLSMAGFYLLLLMFGSDPWTATVGALAYGFSSFFFQVLSAGHNTQAIALAYMAPMIGGIYYSYRKDILKGALFTSVLLTLELLANHPQITYYAFLCLLIFLVTEFIYSIRNKRLVHFLKTSGVLIIPFVIAVGINFASLYSIYEYGKYSIRGKSDLTGPDAGTSSGLDPEYITYWSYGIDETFNLLVPDYKGGASIPFSNDSETMKALRQNKVPPEAASTLYQYWGTQPGTEGPHYMGAIVIFLFIIGLIIIKGPVKWWLLGATLLSLMLSWGQNLMGFTNLFINYFPGYNKFRAVTMTLIIAQFCIPLLGALALKDIFSGTNRDELLRAIKIAGAITGGFLLLLIIVPRIAGSFVTPLEMDLPAWVRTAMETDRKGLLTSDSVRSLVFIILGAATITGFLFEKLKKQHALMILGFLILADLWSVDKRYLNADRFVSYSAFKKTFTPTAADAAILKDKTDYRVLNLAAPTFNDNTPTSYFHKSIGGYHGAKLERYKELIDSSISRDINLFRVAANTAKSVDDFLPVFKKTYILNMLNTKYIIYNPAAPPLVNPYALGSAWFVEKPVMAGNANEEIAGLNRINTADDAVVDNVFKDQVTQASYPVQAGDTIELVSYEPNQLIYKYSAQAEKLAIFSEIYYPAGWKCFIDGKETGYFRADYVLRGVIAPPGNHEIKFVFKPASYYMGNKISLASSVILILLIGGSVVLSLKKRKKTE